jgi:hypothetical protein
MQRLLATVGVIGFALGGASGGPPPSPAELVARLGSEDFREREAAAAALEKAGAAALPALREGARSSDPEVRQRAGELFVKLQRAAQSADKLAAKRVALSYKDAALATALDDLKARTGLNVAIDPTRIADPLRKVTCATGELPVWEALEAFCTAAGLRETFADELVAPKAPAGGRRAYAPPAQVPNPDAVPVVLIDGTGPAAPGARGTAVRVLALPPSFPGHRVTLGTGETTLCFDVTPAPGLNWQDVVAVRITKLTDADGRVGGAGAPRPEAADASPFDAVVAFGGPGIRLVGRPFDLRTGTPLYPATMPNPRVVPVPLKLATPDARKLKRLEGVILGEIVLTNQPLIAVTAPEQHVGSTFDGPGQVRLTVVAAAEGKGAVGPSLQVTLEHPVPWAVAARRGWNPGGIWPEAPRPGNQMPTLLAFDAAGKPMAPVRTDAGVGSDFDGQTMRQNFVMQFDRGATGPAKLVLVGPQPLVVEVPFAMENVPLP